MPAVPNAPTAPRHAGNEATGHWRQYVSSDTLQAADLQGQPHIVTIERVARAQMTDRSDPKKQKGVLNVYFRAKRKPLVCKAELSGVISKLAGSTSCSRWIGVAIEIYPTTVFAFGSNHEVVRISPRRPTAEQAKAAGARAPEPEPATTDMEPDEIREGPSPEEVQQILAAERAEAARQEATR